MKRSINAAVVALAPLLLTGCHQGIATSGTLGYGVRASTLKISPEQASTIYQSAAGIPDAPTDAAHPAITPAALWGRSYVFPYHAYKAKLILDGYFIDGNTGQVEQRTTGKVIEGGMLGPKK